jgi:hypothetical protein
MCGPRATEAGKPLLPSHLLVFRGVEQRFRVVRGRGRGLETNVFGQEVGLLPWPIVRPFSLDDDGVMQQFVKEGRRDDGATGRSRPTRSSGLR